MRVEFICIREHENTEKIISGYETVNVIKEVMTFWNTKHIPLGKMTIKEVQQIVATFKGDADWHIQNSGVPYLECFNTMDYPTAVETLKHLKNHLEIVKSQIDTLKKRIAEYENNN